MRLIKRIGKWAISFMPSSAIVVFHHVTDKPTIQCSGCMIQESQFIDFLNSYNCFDSLQNVIKKPWKKRIAITFDDGLEDLYTIAYPILKKRKIPFTAYIVTDFIGKPGYMSCDQIKEMAADPLVEIGSHGITHEVMTSLKKEQKEYEINGSQKILESMFGQKVVGFAFSHGLYDTETLDLMKNYKYAVSVYSQPLNSITKVRKHRLPRFNIDSDSYESIYGSLSFLKK